MMRGFVIAAAACLLLVTGAYWNSLDNSFHFDDSHVVENNLYIRSLKNIPRFFRDATTFSSLPSNASYRPLVSATLAIDYASKGLDPRPYHRTQIALLLGLGAMLVPFYRRWLQDAVTADAWWIALLAATVFCVHTANTETLNLISSRSEELAVMGVVGSFLLWYGWPAARTSGLHVLPALAGALAKVHAIMYGPLLFVAIWLDHPDGTSARDRTRDALRRGWPALAATVAGYLFVRSMDAPTWVLGGVARLPYLWTQPFVWLHYARLFVLPAGLTADSDWGTFATWYDTRAVAGYVFLAALAFACYRTWPRRATAPIAFGLAWFAIALVPTSSVFPFAEVVNEHRVFFPFVGLTLAAACAFDLALARFVTAAERRRAIGAATSAVIIAALVAGTWQRNKVWRSEESLWLDVATKSPQNGRGLMNYGLTRMARGDYQTARVYFERAAAITPNYSTLEINLGIVHDALGSKEVAEAHFTRALALSPDATSHFFYARWLASVRRGPEAITHLRQSLALSVSGPDTRHLLMRLLAASDANADLGQAAADTLALDPSDRDAVAYSRGVSPFAGSSQETMNAGLAALGARQFADAAEWFRAGVLADPKSADLWNNRGWAQYELGFTDAARESFQRAVNILPTHGRAVNNLALVTKK